MLDGRRATREGRRIVTDRIALMFPGQGSQYPQMARDVLRCSAGRRLLAQAEAISGRSLTQLMATADAVTLAEPQIAQLSVLVHSLALLDQLEADGMTPVAVAGHSLGEYTAMVAAGMLDRLDAMALVSRRGAAMAQAAADRPGAMAAVVGLDGTLVAQLCADAPAQPVVLANVNSPRQVVVSGTVDGVHFVVEAARQAGALRSKLLRVGGAYHSPLMAPAVAEVSQAWASVTLRAPRCPLISSVTGERVLDLVQQARQMRDQLSAPVLWQQTMTTLVGLRPDAVIEVGPGRVLAGLAREQAPTLTQLTIRPEAVRATVPAGAGVVA